MVSKPISWLNGREEIIGFVHRKRRNGDVRSEPQVLHYCHGQRCDPSQQGNINQRRRADFESADGKRGNRSITTLTIELFGCSEREEGVAVYVAEPTSVPRVDEQAEVLEELSDGSVDEDDRSEEPELCPVHPWF